MLKKYTFSGQKFYFIPWNIVRNTLVIIMLLDKFIGFAQQIIMKLAEWGLGLPHAAEILHQQQE